MAPQWLRRLAPTVTAGAALAALALSSLAPVSAAPFDGQRSQFADGRFNTVWTRTDATEVRGGRSWYWGPTPWFDYAEFYREGVNGLRTVQYFDKARMEINNPNDRSGAQQGVTNGLLVKELVSGRLQLGNNPFDIDQREPADVPVAGNPRNDNPNAPGYAAFVGVATIDNGYRDPQRLGQRINTSLDRSGNLGVRNDLALPETEIVQYNSVTGHNIPRVFWDFMNLQGRIVTDGRVSTGPVVDWLFAMGYPITDAYWTRAKIGGVEKDVMVQLFERRALTYVPDNPAGYKVEMGNVGQHYFQWRYPHLGQPWAAPDPSPPLLYASTAFGTSHWEVYMYVPTGSLRLTESRAESVAFSYRRSWEPSQTRVLIDSRRGNGETRQIYEVESGYLYSFNPVSSIRRLTYSDGAQPPSSGPYPGYLPRGTANEYNASYSPDGTKIAFVSDRTGASELFMMPASGNNPIQLTSNGCVNQVPTWSPDGRQLYWESNCGGTFQIYRADVSYNYDSVGFVEAALRNVQQLTFTNAENRFPRVAPNGRTVAFTSYRDGDAEIYLMDPDGSNQRRRTMSAGADEAPTWSPDGQRLAFASNRTGRYEIYTMNYDGSNQTQLTNSGSGESRWPMWAQ